MARNFDHLYTTNLCALSVILTASWVSCKCHAKGRSPQGVNFGISHFQNYGLQETSF